MKYRKTAQVVKTSDEVGLFKLNQSGTAQGVSVFIEASFCFE